MAVANYQIACAHTQITIIFHFSTQVEVVDLKATFELNELSYLRLSSADFTNPNILKSKKLEVLFLNNSQFECNLNGRKPFSPPDYMVAIKSLQGKIKKLVIKDALCDQFFKFCFEANLLNDVEELEVALYDFGIFKHTSLFPRSLRSINCSVGRSFLQLSIDLLETNLKSYVDRFRPDLKVMLYNVPLVKSNESVDSVKRFFHKLLEFVEHVGVDFAFQINHENFHRLKGLCSEAQIGRAHV